MSKKLLLPALLGLAATAQAQWVQVNMVNPQTPPAYRFDHVSTVSANVAWALATENVTGATTTTFVKTNNAAGTEFDFNAVSGAAGYQAANICGLTDQTALVAQFNTAGAGGEIIRTLDGGNTWRKVTTNAQFGAPAGFNNWVHMFNAMEGVAFGDPNGGNFEVLTTANGGTTWTRVPNGSIPQPNAADEAGLVRSYFALGNTIWAGTGTFGTTPGPVRIMKSTNKGASWTVANTPLTGTIQRIAFKDQLNGIAKNVEVTGGAVTAINLIRTTDGGATWTRVTPVGNFYRNDIDAAGGRFFSVGPRLLTGNTLNDFGSSYSLDGINWINIDNGAIYVAADLIDGSTPGSAVGYAGGVTNATTNAGGLFKGTFGPLATRDAALQSALKAYPNPSSNGNFKVDLGRVLQAGATLKVVDALGRAVASQALNATGVAAQTLNLDLSKQAAGIYTLQISSADGLATTKLVIQ